MGIPWVGAASWASGETLVPHTPQKLSPGFTMLPHCVQYTERSPSGIVGPHLRSPIRKFGGVTYGVTALHDHEPHHAVPYPLGVS